MNKKGSGFQTFITTGFVIAAIYFIVFFIFGLGGGFKATWNLGQLVSEIPVWFWLVLALFWLFTAGRRR